MHLHMRLQLKSGRGFVCSDAAAKDPPARKSAAWPQGVTRLALNRGNGPLFGGPML
jgi:hypothetical protein